MSREMGLLLHISRILDGATDSADVMDPVLEAMALHGSMHHGTITLVDRSRNEAYIETAYGLSAEQRARGRYRVGEGVTGRVIESGHASVVPRLDKEPRFLDRTGVFAQLDGAEVSFVCVPIRVGRVVVGALSGSQNFDGTTTLEEYVRLLSIIASMLASVVGQRYDMLEEGAARVAEEQELVRGKRWRPLNLVGNSRAMQDTYDLVHQVSGSDATVLLRGESGVGKELVAHAIHNASPRAQKPFIGVNCAALSDTLLESELFGHERGAFTGALMRRQGRFELADGGTIFLDEIGDFSPGTQVALLRVLQEREFERVGGTHPVKVDVRVIAATNRELDDLISDGSFREDLYYRLNVFPIHIPPLRDRKADLLMLVDHFVERYSQTEGVRVARVSTQAIDILMKYHWPGNVRELENCIERAVLLTSDEVIRAHHLPPTLQTADSSGTTHHGTLAEAVATLERELLVDAMKNAEGNMAVGARALGVSERIMGLRMKKYGLSWRRFRRQSRSG